MRFIHLTDPHLSNLDGLRFSALSVKRRSGYLSWNHKRRRIHRPETLERLTAAALGEPADLIVISGDLVQLGLEDEILQARRWLERLGPPERVLLVPGNHDVYAPESWSLIRRHWKEWLPPTAGDDQPESCYPLVRDVGGVRLIGAASACVTPLFSARGALGAGQLQRLEAALSEAHERRIPSCLAVHHPPLPGMSAWRKALRETRAVAALLERWRPAVVVCGHLHDNIERRAGETRVFSTASASDCVSGSYRVFDIHPDGRGPHVSMRLVSIDRGGEPVSGPSHGWAHLV